jgi:hypothetical protein
METNSWLIGLSPSLGVAQSSGLFRNVNYSLMNLFIFAAQGHHDATRQRPALP